MILQSLKDLALREQLLAQPGFQPKEVAWVITLDEGGSFLGLTSTVTGGGGKIKPRAKKMLIPRQSGRTSGAEAEFLVDKSEYVLGIEPDNKRDRADLEERRELFATKVRTAAEKTGDPGLAAVCKFLSSRDEVSRCVGKLGAEYKSNDLFAFSLAGAGGVPVHLSMAATQYWAEGRKLQEGGYQQCLVCGAEAPPVEKHPPIRVPGGSTSGVALVSFNSDAFESLGLERNGNASVCRDCAEAYTTALNRCLDNAYPSPVEEGRILGRRNLRLSQDTTAVFWGEKDGELLDLFAAILDGSDQDAVRALFGSPYHGRPLTIDSSGFYALILSGAQGRATLRGTHLGTVEAVAGNLRRYFDELAVSPSGPLPLWRLLRSLVLSGDLENLPPGLAGSFFLCAISGAVFPRWLFTAALSRARAEGERPVPYERAALIKAFLNRNLRKEITVALSKDNTDPGYRLGRLFAVLENLQGRAIKNASATITDRFYGAASTRPQSVFVRLLHMAQHHAAKLDGGIFHQRLIAEILSAVPAIPATLSLEQQGMFAVGYYHQREDLWKKRDGPEQKEEQSDGTNLEEGENQ
jgi:CRISPR-associated protein Csd1